jgi:twitching motility protein PilT
MSRLDPLLRQLREAGGSDLHLSAGLVPRMRRRGHIEEIAGEGVLDDATLRGMLAELTSEAQWQEYEATRDLDFAYAIPGVARFRANYLCQENGAAAVFRIVPEKVLSVEDLGLPPAIASLADLAKGLVLVTGPTGSGKSTTLAAVIDRINRHCARHVVTIEDPVEFVHQNQESVFSHREVGAHTRSFGAALRATLRQDADVVLVGEMRDRETIGLAITAAEMGLLVFGTLHTNGAAKTIDRIIDAFPAKEQDQVRLSLSESLAGVVSQLLLPSADGKGRCAVYEILLRTPGLPNVIREGNTPMLLSIIQSGKGVGMQSMDDALLAAARGGRVTPEDAVAKATDKGRFQPLLGERSAVNS